MKKTPISIIIDDSAPAIATPYFNREVKLTADGRPLLPYYPNEAIFRLADIIEKRGVKGKFSVVPMAGNQGDIVSGFRGVERDAMDEWLCVARKKIYPSFSITPEMLSHCKAVNVDTGEPLPEREDEWAVGKNRTALTPYIKRALMLISAAGFDCHGVTSPWCFGETVEHEYNVALSDAIYDVYGYESSYYFLHSKRSVPNVKPYIAYENGTRRVVSVPATIADHIWQTMDTTECSEKYISRVADAYISSDGTSGDIINELAIGSYPILCIHWQSLCSNGLLTGLRVLDEVARRVNEHLSDRVAWHSLEELANMTLDGCLP